MSCVCACVQNHVRCHFPSKNARVDCHFLLQGIFLAQGSNLHLLHWQADSLALALLVKPFMKLVNNYLCHITPQKADDAASCRFINNFFISIRGKIILSPVINPEIKCCHSGYRTLNDEIYSK